MGLGVVLVIATIITAAATITAADATTATTTATTTLSYLCCDMTPSTTCVVFTEQTDIQNLNKFTEMIIKTCSSRSSRRVQCEYGCRQVVEIEEVQAR